MYKLRKENVIKIVDSSVKRDRLIAQGFALVQIPDSVTVEEETIDDYKNMDWKQLLKYASEKRINIKGKKKQEIIEELKAGG